MPKLQIMQSHKHKTWQEHMPCGEALPNLKHKETKLKNTYVEFIFLSGNLAFGNMIRLTQCKLHTWVSI